MSATPSNPQDADPSEAAPYGGIYRDRHLGIFSSHPYWLGKGSRLLRNLTVGVACCLYGGVFYLWMRGHTFEEMLPAFVTWCATIGGRWITGLAAFSIGMLAAGSFQLRMAWRKYHDTELARAEDRAIRWNPAVAIAVFLGGFALPLVLTFAPGMPVELRLFGALIALLPAATLSYLLPDVEDSRISFPWGNVLVMIPSFFAVALFNSVAGWLRERAPDFLLEWFPVLKSTDGWSHAATAIAAAVVVLTLFKLAAWSRTRKNAVTAPIEVPHIAQIRESRWKRLMRTLGLGRLLAKSRENPGGTADAEQNSDETLAWLESLAAQSGCEVHGLVEIAPGPAESVALSEDPAFDLFFDGSRPTLDQHKVLRDFIQLGDDCINPSGNGTTRCGFEMIVEGPAGAGRSITLDAIALLSVVGRGSRVVLLVSDEGRVGFAIQRLRRKLERLNVKHFIEAGTIGEAWQAVSSDQAPPDICVTTPVAWEERLAGSLVREGPDYVRVRQLMCHYATLLVDDWLDHPVEIRAHLPFIIDKHRLLLESEMIPRASVFAFPRLTEAGRHLAADRLLGHAGMIDETRQLARLRYRPMSAARVFDLDADSIDEVVEKIASLLSAEGISSVLLRRGIDCEEAARQTEEFRTRFQASAITVCYCNDQVETIASSIGAILMKVFNGPEAVFALQARRPDESSIMIRVRGRREISLPESITPLIVDRSGRGMAEAHLRNILRFISPRNPVSQRCWGQLGLSISEQKEPSTDRRSGRLLLDLPECISEPLRRGRPYLQNLGGYLALGEKFNRLEAIDCHWIPEPGCAPWIAGGIPTFGPEALILPEPSETGATRNTTVLWKGNDNTELGRSQLHYLATLLLKRRQVFCPDSLRVDAVDGIEIRASRYRDNGRDAIHPKIELQWNHCVESVDGSLMSPESGVGGPLHGYLWVALRTSAEQEITSILIERTDDLDRPTPCFEFEFQHRASVRPLLLGPAQAVVDDQKGFIQALGGFFQQPQEWGSAHPEFLPGLTYALTRGVEPDLPSSDFFGKMLAFRLQGSIANYAKAVVWFVEPLGTGATLSTAVHELLKETGYLASLATRMDLVLRQGWEKSPPRELSRFWLPRRLRRPVSLFERRLVAGLRGDTPHFPVSTETFDWQVTCPSCQKDIPFKSNWGSGAQTISHCGEVICMLVSTSEQRLASPASLVKPWWPDNFPKPAGTETARADAVWKAVANRVEYTFDHQQLEGIDECWLPPAETWRRRLGDCEDHAILFVAMLADLGIQAWLVWGSAGGGHAWVEALIDGRHVRIEATLKTVPSHIPDLGEADAVYRETYIPEKSGPARCDHHEYDEWKNGAWQMIVLATPILGEPQAAETV